MHRVVIIAILCQLSSVLTTDTNYRLNTPIAPSAYSIAIVPYFDTGDDKAFTFDGEVSITFNTRTATNQIKLHSEDLIFTAENITVTSAGGNIQLSYLNPLQFDTNYTFAYINLQNELQVGVEYTLTIAYRGPIREDLNGFYRNYYIENGVKKWLGATQMESTHARKVFPSFDEPDLKATFTLIIDRPQNYKPSLANMKIQTSVGLSNGYVREIFHPTPVMSTYLVAFVVSELEAALTSNDNGKEFGIYTRPEAGNQSLYAFGFGKKVEEALSQFYGVDYYSADSNLKLDHVALPDFRAGAMENWGLVKYREALLLYVPEESTPYYKYRVAQIVAHETTHMWFGNLVTCHWWSNTWLNEGFANYFQDYITAFVDPDVGSADMLVTGSVYSAYDADSSPNSPPITNNDVNSPTEISNHFGTITYQKAGSVIRMMHHLIGDDAFKFGLNAYLEANKFSAGYPDLLYSALDRGVSYYNNSLASYSTANVAGVMSSWISQAGHPILEVNIDYTSEVVTLSQKRFYINSSHSSNETYPIPITYTTELSPDFNNTKPAFIMSNRTHEFSIANINRDHSWVIFNVQETGLYRVNYDSHSWEIIASALKGANRNSIHHLNRAKIVNDLFALFYADEVDFSRLHDTLQFLHYETDYSVWFAATTGFKKLWSSYLGDDALPDIQNTILNLMENIITTLGYEAKATDSFTTLRNRMQVLELACKLGHQGCFDHSVLLYRGLVENGSNISPSLRPVAYCNGLRYGNGSDYEYLWQRMRTTNVANEARTIGEALGCSTDEPSLRKFLLSMQEENSPVKTQDLTVPLTSILSNYSHLHIVMDGLRQDYRLWTSIYKTMDSVVATVASVLRTEADFTEFETWIESCSECTDQSKIAARTALGQARASARWAASHKEDILKVIKSHSPILVPSAVMLLSGLAIILSRF